MNNLFTKDEYNFLMQLLNDKLKEKLIENDKELNDNETIRQFRELEN